MADSTHNYLITEPFERAPEPECSEWFLEFVGFHKQVCGQSATNDTRDLRRENVS